MGDSHTFLFADLAGFTALTEAHGDEQATDLCFEFFDAVAALLPVHHAERVKAIGDELMIRANEPTDAVRLALQIVNEVGAQHGFPMIRIGINTGSAVEREGDWFGATVNLAARVAALAGGGEILVSGGTREMAGDLAGVEWQKRGSHVFKNVAQQVPIFAAVNVERSASGMAIDPVCRMAIDPAHAAGNLTHGGTSYRFCSLACAGAFAAGPDDYTAPEIA